MRARVRSGARRLAPREAATPAQAKGEKLKRQAYREVFGATEATRTRAQKLVLADLARYCHVRDTVLHESLAVMASLEGRRQVWLGRVGWYIDATQEELTRLEDYLTAALGGLSDG